MNQGRIRNIRLSERQPYKRTESRQFRSPGIRNGSAQKIQIFNAGQTRKTCTFDIGVLETEPFEQVSLDARGIDSHADAIEQLKLRVQVVHPASLEEIKREGRRYGI